MRPLAIDLFCGLGGWTEALLAEGYDVVGFDIERHCYPARATPQAESVKFPGSNGDRFDQRVIGMHNRQKLLGPETGSWIEYPAQLVIQDVLTLHGSQFRDAALIVASPPCQFFSYCAMPWSRAKKLAAEVRADPVRLEKELALFKTCFRIQREACAAAGRHIPLIVENVRGAQPWVGRARWNFGSFYLWGDVPALMPPVRHRNNGKGGTPDEAMAKAWARGAEIHRGGSWFDKTKFSGREGDMNRELATKGGYGGGFGWDCSFQTASVNGIKDVPHRTAGHWTNHAEHEGVKCGGDWFNDAQPSISRLTSSRSPARKAASAMIAKIPAPLARHIAVTFLPQQLKQVA